MYMYIYTYIPVCVCVCVCVCIGGGEGERDLLLHPFMHSLVDSCMCPNWGIEPTTLAYQDNALTN